MPYRLPLACVFLFTACNTAPVASPVNLGIAPATVHSFSVDRAYTLTDTRELAYRDQIATEAQKLCGLAGFSLYSSRPVGTEVVGDDFLYRQHDVQITCNDGT